MLAEDRSSPERGVPSPEEARALARRLLAGNGTRLAHVHRAGSVAASLAVLFTPEEHQLLIAAATIHDIGYAPALAQSGFHPLDGAVFLANHGYSVRLAALVAHHSHAALLAPDERTRQLLRQFPDEASLLCDALAYSDMHSHPTGSPVTPEARMADIQQRHDYPHVATRMNALQASIDRVRIALAEALSPVSGGNT